MNRKIRAVSLLAGLFLLAAASLPGLLSTAQAKTTWDFYSFLPVTHKIAKYLIGFTEEVRKRTNGEVDIIFRPAGELPFRATEVVKVVGQNQVQVGEAYQGFIAGTTPLAGVSGLPYLVRTYDDLEKVWPLIKTAADKEFGRFGVRVLFHFSWPPQNLYGVGKPIRKVADYEGRKLRVTDPKQAALLKLLQASAVTLTTPEVPLALERKVVEGVHTAAFNAVTAKWAELLEWAYFTELSIGGPDYVLVNIQEYNKLSPKMKGILDQVAAEWSAKMIREVAAQEQDARLILREKFNLELIYPHPYDVAELIKLVKPYWEEWGKQNGPAGVALVKAVRAKLGK